MPFVSGSSSCLASALVISSSAASGDTTYRPPPAMTGVGHTCSSAWRLRLQQTPISKIKRLCLIHTIGVKGSEMLPFKKPPIQPRRLLVFQCQIGSFSHFCVDSGAYTWTRAIAHTNCLVCIRVLGTQHTACFVPPMPLPCTERSTGTDTAHPCQEMLRG